MILGDVTSPRPPRAFVGRGTPAARSRLILALNFRIISSMFRQLCRARRCARRIP